MSNRFCFSYLVSSLELSDDRTRKSHRPSWGHPSAARLEGGMIQDVDIARSSEGAHLENCRHELGTANLVASPESRSGQQRNPIAIIRQEPSRNLSIPSFSTNNLGTTLWRFRCPTPWRKKQMLRRGGSLPAFLILIIHELSPATWYGGCPPGRHNLASARRPHRQADNPRPHTGHTWDVRC